MTAFALPTFEPSAVTIAAPADPVGIVAEARAEADGIRELARAQGFDEGVAAGRAELEAAAESLLAAVRALSEERAQTAEAVEPAAVLLGLRIAEQALSAALEVQPERVVDVVRGGLRRLVERERVTVLVHPEDLEIVREAAPSLVSQLGGMDHLEVQAERRVSRGGAVVRTTEGEVDATLESKLLKAREAITRSLAGDPDETGDGGE